MRVLLLILLYSKKAFQIGVVRNTVIVYVYGIYTTLSQMACMSFGKCQIFASRGNNEILLYPQVDIGSVPPLPGTSYLLFRAKRVWRCVLLSLGFKKLPKKWTRDSVIG